MTEKVGVIFLIINFYVVCFYVCTVPVDKIYSRCWLMHACDRGRGTTTTSIPSQPIDQTAKD